MALYLEYHDSLSLYNRSLTKEKTKTCMHLVWFPSPQLQARGGSCQWVPEVLGQSWRRILQYMPSTQTSPHLEQGCGDKSGTQQGLSHVLLFSLLLEQSYLWLGSSFNWILLLAPVGSRCFSSDCQSWSALDTYWQLNQELVSPISLLS